MQEDDIELTVLQRAVRDGHFDDGSWVGELLDGDGAVAQTRLDMTVLAAVAIILFALGMQRISKAIGVVPPQTTQPLHCKEWTACLRWLSRPQ